MDYASTRDWAAALAAAAREVLARRPEAGDAAQYGLEVRDCLAHRSCCVQVVYAAAMIEHVRWQEVEPTALAALLLSRMLPRPHED